MIVEPGLESPRPAEGDGFSDSVTIAFGDERADVFGLARAGIAGGSATTGLAVVFHGGAPVAVRAGAGEAAAGGGWDAVRAGGVSTRVEEPLRRWTAAFEGRDGDGGFELELEAVGEPAAFDRDGAAGRADGMEGYESLCRVRGSVTAGGQRIAVDCLGQRGHAWGAPDWDRMTLARTVGAWLGDDLAVMVSAIRPAKGREHDSEAVSAVVLEGSPPAPLHIDDPRLSTVYDGDRRQRRAGFELWPEGERAVVRRGAGEALCGTTLDLGRLRLDCAFFRWRMEGREGVGRYDVLRRA